MDDKGMKLVISQYQKEEIPCLTSCLRITTLKLGNLGLNLYLTSFYFYFFCRLHPHNVLGIRAFADTLACWSLVEASNRYLQKHFVDVSVSEEFLNLNFSDVREIISRDELNVPSEECVSINTYKCIWCFWGTHGHRGPTRAMSVQGEWELLQKETNQTEPELIVDTRYVFITAKKKRWGVGASSQQLVGNYNMILANRTVHFKNSKPWLK